MILFILSTVIFFFVSFSLFYHAQCPAWLKIAVTGIILFICLKYVIYQFVGGAFFAPHLGRSFLLIMEALYGGLLILFLLLLLWDIYLAGNWLLQRLGVPMPARLPSGIIKCFLVAIALVCGFWGSYQAVKVPDIRTVEIAIPNFPEKLSGFSITQLSDLHIGVILDKTWLMKVVEKANSLKSDIIALTGDFVDGYAENIKSELEPLADLKAPLGVYGITGNHEYYWNASQWLEALKKLNIRMLENEHAVLDVNGEKLVVAGLTDAAASRFGLPGPDIHKALLNAPEAVKILLAHRPENANSLAQSIELQLSGHTHGGLIFFLRPIIARFNSGFVNGYYADAKLYVHSGSGLWNGFSFRFGAPAEITKIILRAAK